VRKAGGAVSITVRMDQAVKRAIAGIDEDVWTTIKYPDAIFDETTGTWISKAQVADVPFTAISSKKKPDHISGRHGESDHRDSPTQADHRPRPDRHLGPAPAPAQSLALGGGVVGALRRALHQTPPTWWCRPRQPRPSAPSF